MLFLVNDSVFMLGFGLNWVCVWIIIVGDMDYFDLMVLVGEGS